MQQVADPAWGPALAVKDPATREIRGRHWTLRMLVAGTGIELQRRSLNETERPRGGVFFPLFEAPSSAICV